MPNTDLTLENIEEETRIELGVSGVEIELITKDIQKCIKDALRLYNRIRPKRFRAMLAATKEVKKYRIDNVVPNLIGVVHVEWEAKAAAEAEKAAAEAAAAAGV